MTGGDVLLDRDGVIVRDRPGYVLRPDHVELLPGAGAAIGRLCAAGRRVFVVTNQSAVGRGLLSSEGLSRIHDRLRELLAPHGGTVERFFVCPHHPDDGCACRKPRPGLLYAARDGAGVDLAHAVMVGDSPTDADAAHAAGCAAILVGAAAGMAASARDLAGAVDAILGVPVPC